MAAPAKPRSAPWYEDRERWLAEARDYLDAFDHLPADAPHHAEFEAFQEFAAVKLVFESNLIEKAGLAEGETRKLVQEYFPEVPSFYDSFKASARLSGTLEGSKLDEFRRAAAHRRLSKALIPNLTFAGKSRSWIEVALHYRTYLHAIAFAIEYQAAVLNAVAKYLPAKSKSLMSVWREVLQSPEAPHLLSEAMVKKLHGWLAEPLMPDDAGVPAGHYRIDNRFTGTETSFPAPELVPRAMKRFIREANALVNSTEHPAIKAARISHDFVAIHPFPDFNGRLSRLLLVMVLFTTGVPFAVSLRGDKKGRARYLYALRRADRGDLRPYTTLIARRVVEGFQEVDALCAKADLPSVLSFLPKRRAKEPTTFATAGPLRERGRSG